MRTLTGQSVLHVLGVWENVCVCVNMGDFECNSVYDFVCVCVHVSGINTHESVYVEGEFYERVRVYVWTHA